MSGAPLNQMKKPRCNVAPVTRKGNAMSEQTLAPRDFDFEGTDVRNITINCVSKTVTDWIDGANIPRSTAYGWLRKGQTYFVNKFLSRKLEEAA